MLHGSCLAPWLAGDQALSNITLTKKLSPKKILPRPWKGLGRSLHGAYCIAQSTEQERPGEEECHDMVNAMKAPPQALPGPEDEPSWCMAWGSVVDVVNIHSPHLAMCARLSNIDCFACRAAMYSR